MRASTSFLLALLGACAGHCASTDTIASAPDASITTWQRDWAARPAIVEIDAAPVLYALSDVHGGFDRAVQLLTNAGLLDAQRHWAGGRAVLVIAGDHIDKGKQSVETVRLWQALEPEALAAGGRVVALLGNHEAELLADPGNSKAEALDDELAARGLIAAQYASASSTSGRYLRSLPLAARIAGWFFVHAGTTSGRTLAELRSAFEQDVTKDRWSGDLLLGDGSPLEAQDWWSEQTIARDLAAVGAKHLVMGHDPHAFGEDGLIGAHYQGRLLHIDTGLSPAVDLSKGRLLRVDAPGAANERAVSISHKGSETELDLRAD